MKRIVAGLAAGLVLGSTGIVSAARTSNEDAAADPPQAFVLRAGQAIKYAGMTCTAYAGATAATSNIVCVRNDLKGYGVVVSQSYVVVAKQVKQNGKASVKVFFKKPNR